MSDGRPGLGVYIIVGFLVLAIAVCIAVISLAEPTPTEGLLLGAVLTLLSIIASWITAHYYAAYSSSRNLRVFALKAAEKVTNLSNELERLSLFLQQELEEGEYPSPTETLLARDLRIEGAVHIINTLKSVNDTSLSDWQGVIGQEIIAQRERQEQREEELHELVARLEDLSATAHAPAPPQEPESNVALRGDIEAMKADLRVLASQLGGVPVKRRKPLPPIEQVESTCPRCLTIIIYSQRPREGSAKAITCPSCETKLLSTWVDGRFLLAVRVPVPEGFKCPNCNEDNEVQLDPIPGSSIATVCRACTANLRVFRTRDQVRVRVFTPPPPPAAPPDEALIEAVKAAMPPQPWPKGASRQVSRKLGISPAIAAAALKELVRRGDFKVQIDGELYVPEHPNSQDSSTGA